ncbi:MAG: MATE family efflux transporter, partial [Blautia wexlerae]
MNEKEKVNQITEGVIWKQLLLFFFPIVFGTFFQQIYNTADTIVVGRFVGKQALAAVGGSASQIANLIVGFFVGLSSGASVVISQFYGAKDKKNLSKALHTAFAFSIAAGIVLTVVGIFLTRSALLLMKTPADVVEDSAVYLHIYFGGMVFNLVYNMGAAILRAVGDSKRPLYVLIITCVLNIILDLLFVVAFGMGVTGVAVATVTSQVISALIVTVMLLKTREIYVLKINQIRFDRRMLFSVLRIGIPAGLESVMYNISNIVIQVFVNNLGTDTVAAWGTLGKIDALFWMVINAFAISITTFVGQNFGAGKYHRMRKSVSVCMIMSMASSAVLIILMYSFAPWIYRLFTTDSAVIV